MNELADTDMWVTAVTDHDADEHRRQVVGAKVGLAGTWPFLAAASGEDDFEHRLALMREQIEAVTPPEVLGDVVASLREDFHTMAAQHEAEVSAEADQARSVTAASYPGQLPRAYVHVQDKGEYWQVDRVVDNSVTFLGRTAANSDPHLAVNAAVAQQGLPVFVNGTFYETPGTLLPRVASDQEFMTADGKWVRLAERFRGSCDHCGGPVTEQLTPKGSSHVIHQPIPATSWQDAPGTWVSNGAYYIPGDDHQAHVAVRHSADATGNTGGTGGTGTAQRKSREKTGICTCGKTNLGIHAKQCPQCGDHVPGYKGKQGEDETPANFKSSVFNPDPSDAWRYNHYPPVPPSSGVGGQPPAPLPPNSPVGPDGFPPDLAEGEQRTPEAYARQTTPSAWVVPPDAAWPADLVPNAATGLPQGVIPQGGNPAQAVVARRTANENGTSDDFYGGDTGGRDYVKCTDCGESRARAGRPCPSCGSEKPKYTGVLRTGAQVDEHVTSYVDWARKNGHDPDEATTLKHYERQPGIGRSHTNAIADQLYIGGGESDWRRHSSLTYRGSEGVRPPGPYETHPPHDPNPNYFSNDSNGLASPPGQSFPEDPGPEPKTNNNIDDFYGDVPPEQSQGSSQGTIDGQGYSRQAAAYSGNCTQCQGSGRTGDHNQYKCPNCDGKGTIKTAEYNYVKKQGDSWVVTQKGTGKVLSHHDSEEDAKASFRAMMQSKHSGARSPDFPQSARERTASGFGSQSVPAGAGYRLEERQPPENEDSDCNCTPDEFERTIQINPMCPEHGHFAHEGALEYPCPDRTPGCKLHYVAVANTWWHTRRHAKAPATMADEEYREGQEHERRGLPPETAFGDLDDVYDAGYASRRHELGRMAGTTGQIVGHCDHCRNPVRWHDGEGESGSGHLEHLHSGSHKCNPGASSTTTARTAGLERLPQFFDPHLAQGDVGATTPPSAVPGSGPGTTPGDMGGGVGGGGGLPGAADLPNADPSSQPPQVSGMGITGSSSGFTTYPAPNLTHTSLQTITAPTPENPSGRSEDEYKANTWKGLIEQRPMQSAEDRHVNTPVKPEDHIHTRNINTPTPGLDDENEDSLRHEDDDDEDDED